MWEKSKQDQNVGNGATAAQAGRDVIINHGMSLAQMAEVIREVYHRGHGKGRGASLRV